MHLSSIQMEALHKSCKENLDIPNRRKYVAHGISLALIATGVDIKQVKEFMDISDSIDAIFRSTIIREHAGNLQQVSRRLENNSDNREPAQA